MKKNYVKPTSGIFDAECKSCLMAGSLGTSEKPADGGTSVLSTEDEDIAVSTGYLRLEDWR